MGVKRWPVKEITRAEMDKILDSEGDTYEPRGLFICTEMIGGVEVYTAMRNIDGEGMTEDFVTHMSAVRWLHGFAVSDRMLYKPLTVARVAKMLREKQADGEW